ncbi:StbB family protein [Pseudomonas savastanoi pv. phaseolicola]|uniref:StbB family protein n=2 Tax=Pseudomonas savastanoi TaxID=29438 RepID=UPI000E323967|nr:StbB family protein [Pseudomonas savastanoi]MDG6381267.1 StbB family protein [Pseudomonas savastanoi pv. phaseolicola]
MKAISWFKKKVVVINYTGTVGKTTIAANLLWPRMGGAPLYAIESINETAENLGLDVEKLRGNAFRELFKRLMLEDQAIIDVGASNVEDFMANLEEFDEAHEEVDYFVIPVTSGTKEQKETVSMIGSLASLGVPPEKILVLFNRVKKDVNAEFPIIFAYHQRAGAFTLNPECAVFESALFDALSIHRISMQTVMDDDTDYKTLLKNKDASAQERDRWSDMFGLTLLCKGVNRKLDRVFAALFSLEVIK